MTYQDRTLKEARTRLTKRHRKLGRERLSGGHTWLSARGEVGSCAEHHTEGRKAGTSTGAAGRRMASGSGCRQIITGSTGQKTLSGGQGSGESAGARGQTARREAGRTEAPEAALLGKGRGLQETGGSSAASWAFLLPWGSTWGSPPPTRASGESPSPRSVGGI